jgi:hypothetical protein
LPALSAGKPYKIRIMQKQIAGLILCYDAQENEAASIIGAACERSVRLIHKRWGLATPRNCRVYVMTSWSRFLFQATPGIWKAYIALVFPLMAVRARALWKFAGGWAFTFGRRRAVGVKPPRLIQAADRSVGSKIYIHNDNFIESVQSITCHELVHAFTAHLRLPSWLNEGLATLAQEIYLERRLVREETREYLKNVRGKGPGSYGRSTRARRPEELVALYAQGYWLARYIEETKPELMRDLLAKQRKPKEIEAMLAKAYGISQVRFWEEFSARVLTQFL